MPSPAEIASVIDETYRRESRRVFASLVRGLRDFDLAEEVEQPGMPGQPFTCTPVWNPMSTDPRQGARQGT